MSDTIGSTLLHYTLHLLVLFMSRTRFAQIAVSLPLDGLYTYSIPNGMNLEIGHAVLVPFGQQRVSGYVIELLNETHLKKVRPIGRILDPTPVFDTRNIPFFKWIARYYLSGLGEVIATALPRDYKGKSIRVYVATEDGVNALAKDNLKSANQRSI